ncbi:visual system homeobox 1 [Striga asiatica]|uniref:Visual system homeobox 1 n=1 Tax=Striga asiatica TaxID=4170 RepID=A0A5A7PWA4_STRAF|nr:visual system homeobox 1 [Striga asiatica]
MGNRDRGLYIYSRSGKGKGDMAWFWSVWYATEAEKMVRPATEMSDDRVKTWRLERNWSWKKLPLAGERPTVAACDGVQWRAVEVVRRLKFAGKDGEIGPLFVVNVRR